MYVSIFAAVSHAYSVISVPSVANLVAAQWISTHAESFANNEQATFAITQREGGMLCGAIGLIIHRADRNASLGYWLGLPYWSRGYMTEAAQAVVQYGFNELDLHRIYATHITRNPASGRVMQKIGMTCEGTMRQHVLKWDVFEDLAYYGMLRSEPLM